MEGSGSGFVPLTDPDLGGPKTYPVFRIRVQNNAPTQNKFDLVLIVYVKWAVYLETNNSSREIAQHPRKRDP
jgi:hypothetical protein